MDRQRFFIDKKSFWGRAAVACFVVAVVFRMIGSYWHIGDWRYLVFMAALPILSCVLFILAIEFLGKKHFRMSFLPLLLGVLFFMSESLMSEYSLSGGLTMLWTVLSLLVCLLTAVLYSCTVFGAIRTKFFLIILFLAALVGRVGWMDIPNLKNTSFSEGITEISTLALILALFFVSCGLRKQDVARKDNGVIPAPTPGNVKYHSAPSPRIWEDEPSVAAPETAEIPAPVEDISEGVPEYPTEIMESNESDK